MSFYFCKAFNKRSVVPFETGYIHFNVKKQVTYDIGTIYNTYYENGDLNPLFTKKSLLNTSRAIFQVFCKQTL